MSVIKGRKNSFESFDVMKYITMHIYKQNGYVNSPSKSVWL